MYVSINDDNIVKAASATPMKLPHMRNLMSAELDSHDTKSLLGKQVVFSRYNSMKDLKVAVICNWGDHCGIATYTQYLIDSLRPKVGEVRIFAERILGDTSGDEAANVTRCWTRGESMVDTINSILEWQPDFVMIQHEFGIFPKATHFLKMLELLDKTPYSITLHSVYEHLDKTICTAHIRNIIVHSQEGRQVLATLGHLNNVDVVSHGCVVVEDHSELWNIFHNDYVVIQFGFGFNYKGVDQAIAAIAHLKQHDEKFKNIFYCYLCSENPHTRSVHEEYYGYLKKRVNEYGLRDNVVILRGFLSEKVLSNFLRTAKLAIFPYKNDPNNCVYAASGAVRLAMANGIPVIASESHLFDDLQGVVPRVTDHIGLAQEIDRVFSDQSYSQALKAKCLGFVADHTWEATADGYLACFQRILRNFDKNVIRLTDYMFTD
jgi:glycosyltransferase involved in cell wall biosynthesis